MRILREGFVLYAYAQTLLPSILVKVVIVSLS